MKPSGVVTLLTDFGQVDPYVGVMKGVILDRFPSARIVDVTHAIAPQNVTAANFALRGSWPWFPSGTVHVVVVDPGVGSSRRILCAVAHGHVFLAPDNGVLTNVVMPRDRVFEVTNSELFLPEVSRTFHGRDIFAPVAAGLASGLEVQAVGAPVARRKALDLPAVEHTPDGEVIGGVIHVDTFGNLVTNIGEADVPAFATITLADLAIGSLVESYSAVPVGQPLAIIGSFGLLEIAVHRGSAAEILGAAVGTDIRVRSPAMG